MKSGKSLAIAYNVKSKSKKKMAEGGKVGGEVNVRQQKRPMPNNEYNDSKSVSKNSGNKPPHEDSWSDDTTVRQSQKPSITRLSQPKIIGSDTFSVRNMSMRDYENDLGNNAYPESDKAQPHSRYNEDGPNRQGPNVPDMSAQHNNKKPPYNKVSENQYSEDMANANMKKTQSPLGRYAEGGEISPDDEIQDEKSSSIAAAIMANRDRLHANIDSGAYDEDAAARYANGGVVDHIDPQHSDDSSLEEGQVDIDDNARELPNAYYGRNEDKVLKENYDEDVIKMSQPEDSNEHGDDLISDVHDMVDSIRRKMKSKRQFKGE